MKISPETRNLKLETFYRKPWPAELDQWSHFLHDASNNAVSQDTEVDPPQGLRWTCGPEYARSHEHFSSMSAMVTAGGRIFYIIDEGPISSVYLPPQWKLVARDAFSGVLLWQNADNELGIATAWFPQRPAGDRATFGGNGQPGVRRVELWRTGYRTRRCDRKTAHNLGRHGRRTRVAADRQHALCAGRRHDRRPTRRAEAVDQPGMADAGDLVSLSSPANFHVRNPANCCDQDR